MTGNRSFVIRMIDRTPAPIARYARGSPVVSKVLAPLINPILPAEASEVTVRSGPGRGIRLIVDPRSEKFYWAGVHEFPVQQFFTRVLRPGDVVWDIGAHVGFFSCLASRLVDGDGLVVAFEPMAENRRRLLEAVRMNGLTNVVVKDTAVSGSSGRAVLHAAEASTMWSLVDHGGDTSIEVDCRTLDDELRSGVRPPTLVKVDVEGAEVDVLAGATFLFEAHRPLAIVEFHSAETLERAQALFRDYRFEHLHERNWLLRAREVLPHT